MLAARRIAQRFLDDGAVQRRREGFDEGIDVAAQVAAASHRQLGQVEIACTVSRTERNC